MTYAEVIENAKNNLGKFCKGCPECNGRACKNQVPGPGSKGVGDTAIRNYDMWKQVRVNMDTLTANTGVDTKATLFGREFAYPFFAGPVGAVMGTVVGVLAPFAIDKIFIEVDEYKNRESYKQDIISCIQEERQNYLNIIASL